LDLSSPREREAALERVFDYRGDVTLLTTGGEIVEGYVFDRDRSGPSPYIRLLSAKSGQRVTIQYHDVVRVVFSGRDTAAGKSWESWVKRYLEKKARGESTDAVPDAIES
jgi:hypothetical protein